MSDPFVEVMEPLRVLRQRVEAAGAACGLKVVHVGVVPGAMTEGPHEVQILAILADEPPVTDDSEFRQVLQAARDAELDERAQAVHDELQSHLKNPGGFLE